MYNVKALISKIQTKITNEYLQSVNKRPFIVSRANTIGHGKYGFHWLGDNISTFEMLLWSISGIFNYNIFTEWSVVYNLTDFSADYAVNMEYDQVYHLNPKDF